MDREVIPDNPRKSTPFVDESFVEKTSGADFTHGKRWRRAGLFFLVALPTILVIFLFRDVVFHDRLFAFRDAAHFHYPLFWRVQTALENGRLPLWDSMENLGQPLLANPAASVFYPGKVIFFLSTVTSVSFETSYKIYVLGHLLLAFYTFYFFARRWLPPGASLFGAVSYALSGPVFFQYSNVLFLIGAAWLPLFLTFGFRLVERGRFRDLFLLAVVMAMIVLGGDPETAYLGGVALAIYLFARRLTSRSFPLWRRLVLLTAAGFFGVVLSAVQLLPSWEMAGRSSRSVAVSPRCLWEIPGFESRRREFFASEPQPSRRSLSDGIFCRDLDFGGHSRAIYSFSLPPWRMAEFLWPNIGGDLFPENSRWLTSLPEGRFDWTESVYFGTASFWLALAAGFSGIFSFFSRRFSGRETSFFGRQTWKNRALSKTVLAKESFEAGASRRFIRVFFSVLVTVALLASFGGFGAGWSARMVGFRTSAGDEGGDGAVNTVEKWAIHPGDPVGGLYWGMVQLLPGFASFRYPAKLATFGMVGFAFLAGWGLDTVCRRREWGRRGRVGRWLVGGAAILSLAGGFFVFWGGADSLFRGLIGESGEIGATFYGPCPLVRTRAAVVASLFHAGLATATFWIWLTVAASTRRTFSDEAMAWWAVFFLAIDLTVASSPLISTCPAAVFRHSSQIAETIRRESEREIPVEGRCPSNVPPPRVFRDWTLAPERFFRTSSPNRPAEKNLWDVETLFPGHSACRAVASADVRGTMTAGDWFLFSSRLREETRRRKETSEDGRLDGRLEESLAFLGIDWMILSPSTPVDSSRAVCLAEGDVLDGRNRFPAGSTLWRITPSNGIDSGRVRIFHEKSVTDLSKSDPVKKRSPFEVLSSAERIGPLPGERAVITRYEPERIELTATLSSPGYLLLAEEYWRGWRATATRNSPPVSAPFFVEIRREGGFLRRIDLPAGDYSVVLEYRPLLVKVGIILSLIGWLVVLGAVIMAKVGKGKRPTG